MRPEAPYPADTRAKGWRFELDYEQIEQSDTWSLAPADVKPWLLMMWLTAWKQVPCGSLPGGEEVIAAKLGMAPKAWQKGRDILMRGWVEASDGRRYHNTLTFRVLEMVEYRAAEAARRAAYRDRMKAERVSAAGVPPSVPPTVTPDTPLDTDVKNDTGTGTGTGTGTKKEKEKASPKNWQPPEWVPAKEWHDFEQMRRAIRNVPFTDAAREGVVRELAKFQALGHDPAKLLIHAVTNGHRTIYEPKSNGGSNGSKFVSKQEQIEAHNHRVGEEWLRSEEERDATH